MGSHISYIDYQKRENNLSGRRVHNYCWTNNSFYCKTYKSRNYIGKFYS